MQCRDVEKVKPLDKLLGDKIGQFDSGGDRECDRDLDKMIWDLGDFENEEPLLEAEEFEEEPPIEEELIEKKIIARRNGRAGFRGEGPAEEDLFAGGGLATARSIGTEPGKKKRSVVRGRTSAQKKK
jgi:hypothetical protein